MAPYFLHNEWQWKHCTVLSFDSGTNKFHIKFSHNSQEKKVKRFNLLFDAESRELWQFRRVRAREEREAAKRRLRFDFFLSKQPMEEVRAVQGSTIRGIHEKVADGLPLDVTFPQQGTPLGHIVRDLTKQVIQQHTRSMKKSILFHKLEHFETEKQRYDRLRLEAIPEPATIPWSSKVDTPEYPFHERRKAIGNIHYSSLSEVKYILVIHQLEPFRLVVYVSAQVLMMRKKKNVSSKTVHNSNIHNVYDDQVLGALLYLHQVWEKTFLHERLVDTRLETLELPCKVENFCETQVKHHSFSSRRVGSILQRPVLVSIIRVMWCF